MSTIRFETTTQFDKEFKKLSKKYHSLPKDLELFKRIIEEFPRGNGNRMPIITEEKGICIVKSRLACESLKGAFLRVIYAFEESCLTIFFIELYYKGDKEAEDESRIKDFLSTK